MFNFHPIPHRPTSNSPEVDLCSDVSISLEYNSRREITGWKDMRDFNRLWTKPWDRFHPHCHMWTCLSLTLPITDSIILFFFFLPRPHLNPGIVQTGWWAVLGKKKILLLWAFLRDQAFCFVFTGHIHFLFWELPFHRLCSVFFWVIHFFFLMNL